MAVEARPAGGRPVHRTGLRRRLGLHTLSAREALFGYSIVGVVYLFFLIFVFGPMFLAFGVSLTWWDALSPISQAKFIGLENYRYIFFDERFRLSLLHDAEYTVKAYVGQIGLGLLLALLINNLRRWQTVARIITFSPVVLPLVATAILFVILMNPTWGLFNVILRALGLPPSTWLQDPTTAMNSVVLMVIWKYVGYYIVLFLAALQTVPQEYYDAAHIDGAGPWQTFWHITLPLLRPTIAVAALFRAIDALKAFDIIYAMTQGGPGEASETLNIYVYYSAFQYFRFGYASSLLVLFFALILGVCLVIIKLRREAEAQG